MEGILLPPLKLPWRLKLFFDSLFEKIFTYIGLIEMKDDFLFSDIQMRSACFIKEAKKLGIKFKAAKGPIGYTNYFCAEVKGRRIRFEGLPIADHINASISSLVDNKEKTKEHLKVHGFPVAPGKSFLLWQKDRAVHYGVYELGFPLVVKPRSGSVARHVTRTYRMLGSCDVPYIKRLSIRLHILSSDM